MDVHQSACHVPAGQNPQAYPSNQPHTSFVSQPQTMKAWDVFASSGKIADYLAYRETISATERKNLQ